MKKSLLFIAGVLGLGALAGCTVGGTENNVDSTKFNISISARSSAVEQNILKTLKAGYEKSHSDVNIIIDGWGSKESSEEYIQQFALNRSQLTDIIYTTDDKTAYLAQMNNFVDLRKYYESSPETDYTKYYASMLDTTTFGGEFRPTTTYTGDYVSANGLSDKPQYGVYFAPREYNMPGLILNKDLFVDANIALPVNDETWTFDAFAALLQEISEFIYQKVDVEKINKYSPFRGIEMNQCWEPIYTSIMKHFGGDGLFAFDKNGDPVSNLGSESNVNAYKQIIKAFGNGKYKYAVDQDLAGKDFGGNTIFMCTASYPEVANFIETCPNLYFMPFPTEYVAAGCGGYGILTDTLRGDRATQTVNGVTKKTVDLCWDFVKYIISKEGQDICGEPGYIQPVLKELALTGKWTLSFDPELDHSAFCKGKELRLDTYNFAEPKTRSNLRNDIAAFFKSLFSVSASEDRISAYISTANASINPHLITE